MAQIYNWDAIINDLGPRLYRHFCVRFSDEQSDDLTQEALLRLVEKVEAGSYDATKGTLRMYAFGIAHFIALEHGKSERTNREIFQVVENLAESELLLDIAEVTTLEEQMILKSDSEFLRTQIKKLSFMEQQVIALLVDDELSIEEIGTILQCPIGTVKSHIHRAKTKLTEMFNKIYGEQFK